MKTVKRKFQVNVILNGVVIYSTVIFAANSTSLWHTSPMRDILLNKSSESFIDVKEFKDE